jgi:hypothetical protein
MGHGTLGRKGMTGAARYKRSKFGNRKSGGYDSRREHKRATELKLLEQIGQISDLREQVKFELIPKQDGERATHYIADFVYVEKDQQVVEDTKGFKTPDYIIKRKLMLMRHGIRIREV